MHTDIIETINWSKKLITMEMKHHYRTLAVSILKRAQCCCEHVVGMKSGEIACAMSQEILGSTLIFAKNSFTGRWKATLYQIRSSSVYPTQMSCGSPGRFRQVFRRDAGEAENWTWGSLSARQMFCCSVFVAVKTWPSTPAVYGSPPGPHCVAQM